MITSPSSHATGERVDACFLGLLPWLASRFDLPAGVFRGEGAEADVSASLLTAQGREIFHALGLHSQLPHVVRLKLDRCPRYESAVLAERASDSRLARATRLVAECEPSEFLAALRLYKSPDNGYDLNPGTSAPGSMAAAHHLLVIVRPRWFAVRSVSPPAVSPSDVAALNDRLLVATAP